MSRPQRAEFNNLQDDTKYRLLFEDAPLAIFILDGYVYLECNKKAEEILGYSQEELRSNSPAKYSTQYQPNGEPTELYAQKLLDAAMAGEPQYFEWTIIWPDDQVRLLEVALTPIYLEGEITRLTHAIARDITRTREWELKEEKQRSLLQQISESTSEYIFIKDLDGKYQYVNKAGANFIGVQPGEMIGKRDDDFFDHEMAKIIEADDSSIIRDKQVITYEETISIGDKSCIFETTKGPFYGVNYSVDGLFGISRDVTELREAERYSESVTRDLAERVKELTCINKVTNILDRRDEPIGKLMQEVVVVIPAAMQYPDDACAVLRMGSNEYASADYIETETSLTEMIRSRGDVIGNIEVGYLNAETKPVFLDEERDLLKIIADKISAVAERKKDDEHIRHLAFYDALTGLPNRQLLIDRMQHAIHTSHRNGTKCALFYLDLDNFKNLNDAHGHDVGDEFLCQVTDRLLGSVRESDTVARFGGDEFIIILQELNNDKGIAVSEASKVADKILASFNQPFELEQYIHYATASIGVTIFTGNESQPEELLKQADISMYQAKSAGRNTYRFFDPNMQALLNTRVDMDNNMRQGLQNDEFSLYYQPQVNSHNELLGCEGLIRWQHPEHGMILPGIFIPIAEDTGFIIQLGRWTLEQACNQIVSWSGSSELKNIKISVNISANQFRHPGFVNDVLDTINRTGANPGQLKLELTESFIIADIEDAIHKMSALKDKNVSFSLDDFGTGYSSLAYLKRLPLDELKIDRSFISNVLKDENDAAIVRTIIALGKTMNLSIVAEGVETQAQRQFLLSEGCDLYQGYLFSEAVPGHELPGTLQSLS